MPPAGIATGCPQSVQVYRAQHNETVYAVKVLTGIDDLVMAAAALSLSDPLLHKFEQVHRLVGTCRLQAGLALDA